MEGQAPWQKAKKEKKETQAVANSVTPIAAAATEMMNSCMPPLVQLPLPLAAFQQPEL